MKHRNIAVVIILGFVTLGIYPLYWLYATRKELIGINSENRKNIWPVSYLLAPIILMIATFAFYVISIMTIPESGSQDGFGIKILLSLMLYFLSALVFLGFSTLWIHKYSKALYAMTNGMSPALHTTLWAIFQIAGLAAVWPALAQNEINDYILRDSSEPTNAANPEHNTTQQQ